jgi:hypothetical protein
MMILSGKQRPWLLGRAEPHTSVCADYHVCISVYSGTGWNTKHVPLVAAGITWLCAYHLLWVPQTDAPDREAWWKRMLLSGKMDHLLEGPLAPLTCENHLKPVWMEARREFMMKVPSMIKTQYVNLRLYFCTDY